MSRVLVIGATGQQGGAVARALLEQGSEVVGFVRGAAGPAERALESHGIHLAVGSLDDAGTITTAAKGVDAVFAMTTPFAGLETEIRHGVNIAAAADDADVPFLLYSSVASADQATGIGHFDSKWEIEKHIQALGLPAAVVAPVFFMNNYLFPSNLSVLSRGVLRQAVRVDVPLQLIDSDDIGRFAALMLSDPDRFIGRRIEIAGDERVGPDIAAALGHAAGESIRYEVQPDEELAAMGEDWARMYEWFNEGGFTVNRRALAADYPEFQFTSLEAFAAKQDWGRLIDTDSA